MTMMNRRQFGLLSAGLLAPRRLLARPSGSAERKFLFIFNDGGWDTGHVFTPYWEVNDAMVENDAQSGLAHGIPFVDHPNRPAVRAFFTQWGGQTAVLNGLEVQSITHERCREIMLTGQGPLADDWATVLAAQSTQDLLIPHVILDGPAFTSRFTSSAVRVGDSDQLPDLLAGHSTLRSDLIAPPLPTSAESQADAFVAARAAESGGVFGQSYADALDKIQALRSWDELNLTTEDAGCERHIANDCALAFDMFSRGLSRCAMLRYQGWCDEGWDTHQGLPLQSKNFDDLFLYLNEAMADLQTRTSHTGNPLADEVTIVVFSEMGREPRLNGWGGRDHWTFTSTMLIGSGIRGGQVIGGLDVNGQGRTVDLGTGGFSDGGVIMLPEHLGATLLALGDVDPAAHVNDAQPIGALLS